MTINNQVKPIKPDQISVLLLPIPIIAALSLVFKFYFPRITQAVSDNLLPREVLSLKIHIDTYCLPYCLFAAGLFLPINRFFARNMVARSWIEITTIINSNVHVHHLVSHWTGFRPDDPSPVVPGNPLPLGVSLGQVMCSKVFYTAI